MSEVARPSAFPQPVAAAWDGLSGLAVAYPEKAPRKARLLVALAVAIMAALSGLVGWLTWDLRRISLTEATAQHVRLADRAADLLAKEIDLNALLLETIRVSMDNPATATMDDDALHALLFNGLRDIGAIGEILVTDSDGHIVQSLNPWARQHNEIGRRAYFKAHRDDPLLGLQISGPLISPYTGKSVPDSVAAPAGQRWCFHGHRPGQHSGCLSADPAWTHQSWTG